MRVVLQRVSQASVTVDGKLVAAIGRGLCLLVGVGIGDHHHDADVLAAKIGGLRVFPDDQGKMNLSVLDVGGEILVVSQFTLLGEVSRGRRPSFTAAASPEEAAPLVEYLAGLIREQGILTATGVFGARMEVSLVNEGPVTLIIEARQGSIV